MALSQSQLTKLGERLRVEVTEADLILLDEYRRSFEAPGAWVADQVAACTGFIPTKRNSKSSQAIIEKLRRQTSRLGRIQDIAGCRLNVSGRSEQSIVVAQLIARFPNADVKDRLENPSHGYRAIHVVVRHEGFLIEVQVRTILQHLWGQLSEKLADRFGNEVKYGGGPEEISEMLSKCSEVLARIELGEVEIEDLGTLLGGMTSPDEALLKRLIAVRRNFNEARESLGSLMKELLSFSGRQMGAP